MQRLLFVSACLVAAACEPGDISGEGPTITITPERATLAVGDSARFSVKGADKYIVWTSSDSVIMTVNSVGLVRGRSPGVAIVTVSSFGGGAKQSAFVTVTAAP